MREIPRIHSDSPELNRVQDAIRGSLHPALRLLDAVTPLPCNSTTRPVATADMAGRFVRVKDANLPEHLQVCLQNADGSWAWADCALAPR